MMKLTRLTAFTAAALALTACGQAETKQTAPEASISAGTTADKPSVHTATFIANDRMTVGKVTLTDMPKGVEATIEIEGLTPSLHGMHFHVKADCEDEGFKNSGGHINPDNHQHGLKNPDGPDNADMPNLRADDEGRSVQTVFNDRISFYGKAGRPALFDEDGSAMIIHANPDDHMTQPIGGAGARVACAVIKS